MPLPKFIGIGAPRCGTRWLAQCLSEHPQIALPPHEVYFFTTRRLVWSHWSNGLDWYSRLFEDCRASDATTWGEITPVYLFDDDTPQLMHECVPDAKLVCCLRDQSDRAYSWYRLFLHFNPEIFSTDFSFRRFLTYHDQVYGREGFYLEHLQRYLAFYPRELILITLYDDLKRDPKSYIQHIYGFLEVDPSFAPTSLRERVNPMNLELPRNKSLRRILESIGRSQKLHRVGLDGFAHVIDRFNTLKVMPEDFPTRHQMDPEIKARMADLYRDHNKELGKFLGRDLSHWNCDGNISKY
jgi:hypothetical protein